mmetsp:Transcript_26287/g.51224  ORF Transcript_26287/g.51224 Transcript_26287/m.51224 type:complete len:424 (+) Transcript_26287:111-1382(+)
MHFNSFNLQAVRDAFNFKKDGSQRELRITPSFWTEEADVDIPKNMMHFELPSHVNEKPDVQHQMEKLCEKKASLSFARLCFLGLLSGVWMALSASCAMTAAAGISQDVVKEWPIISKFVLSLFAPVAMHFIVVFGGEFFSGNCMYFCVGLLKKRVTIEQAVNNLFWVFIWNALGCVCATYMCLYLTQIFAGEQERKFVIAAAQAKANMPWMTSLIRAIPANILICTSIQMGIAAREMAGKIAVLHFPLTMYTVSGFEHCITNLVVVPLGIMYGADIHVTDWLWNNLLPATIGNFIGGGIIVGGFVSIIYSWDEQGHGNHNVPKPLRRRGSLVAQAGGMMLDKVQDVRTAVLRTVAHPDDLKEIDVSLQILRDVRKRVADSEQLLNSVEDRVESKGPDASGTDMPVRNGGAREDASVDKSRAEC